jgi:hypothetical protein
MRVALYKSKSCGLEVWQVYVNGSLVHEFLSEAMARTAYVRLKSKLGF